MIVKGSLRTCNFCGTSMFVPNGENTDAGWVALLFDTREAISRKNYPVSDLCPKCAERLTYAIVNLRENRAGGHEQPDPREDGK